MYEQGQAPLASGKGSSGSCRSKLGMCAGDVKRISMGLSSKIRVAIEESLSEFHKVKLLHGAQELPPYMRQPVASNYYMIIFTFGLKNHMVMVMKWHVASQPPKAAALRCVYALVQISNPGFQKNPIFVGVPLPPLTPLQLWAESKTHDLNYCSSRLPVIRQLKSWVCFHLLLCLPGGSRYWRWILAWSIPWKAEGRCELCKWCLLDELFPGARMHFWYLPSNPLTQTTFEPNRLRSWKKTHSLPRTLYYAATGCGASSAGRLQSQCAAGAICRMRPLCLRVAGHHSVCETARSQWKIRMLGVWCGSLDTMSLSVLLIFQQ